MEGKDTEYMVTVRTGVEKWAGCDNNIKIEIHGTQGKTNLHSLTQCIVNDLSLKNLNLFENGQTDEFQFKDIDVGKVEFIGLQVKEWMPHKDIWYLEYIEVQRTSGETKLADWEVRFPVYSWIVPSPEIMYIYTNKTCIPQKESSARIMGNRRAQLTMKNTVRWNDPKDRIHPGFPGYMNIEEYDKLDLNLKYTERRLSALLDNKKKVMKNAAFKVITNKFNGVKVMSNYLKAAKDLNKHFIKSIPWLENDLWKTDEEFGRQVLNGYNPTLIERCRQIPENFPVSDHHVKDLLTRGLSLEEEVLQGYIYIINHKILEDIPTGYYPIGSGPKKGKKLELAAAMCLFYLDDNEDFRPIAIQLGQEHGEDFPIWTPNDSHNDWLLAKMWFRNADYQVHQMKSHLAMTHLLVEPIAIAMHRCLPPCHPVHKLLREHVQYLIAINTIGRKILLEENGSADKALSIGHGMKGFVNLVEKSFKEFHFENDWDFPTNIDHRGVSDIPNYHFRDDALVLWQKIEIFVADILNIFYDSDEEVQDDSEVKEWIKEIYSIGYGFGNVDENGKFDETLRRPPGLPDRINSKSELVSFITKIIFQSAVIHSAVNFMQFEYGCFAPNVPSLMKGKIPKECDRGNITEENIMKSLPGLKPCLTQAGVSFALTQFSKDEVFLLPDREGKESPPRWMFTEESAKKAQDKFVQNLEEIEARIISRNENLVANGKIPYEVLRPSRIPYGITI